MARKIEIVEMPKPKREVPNTFRIPVKQWRTWDATARRTFNQVCGLMRSSPDLFMHPKQPKPKPFHWKTVSHNAAWIAADAVMGR